ncbi:MAG: pyridoxal-phosphate-dependent aminotransferase family protein [Candidatus Freyarchaeota archaeon]
MEFLMTPGPTEIPVRVLRALIRPAIGPNDSEFVKVMDETEELLKKLFQTKNEVIFFPGSGRVAIESAILSVVEPNDEVLVGINGVFGKWLRDMVARVGGKPVEVHEDWRKAIEPHKIKEKLESEADIKAVALVHNETSTGIVNPIEKIGKIVKDYGALYIVDTVSSLGGDMVKTDEWGIDLNCTGSYKCIGSLPGLAIISVSDEAWDCMVKRRKPASSFWADLYKWLQMWIPKERGGKLIWGYRRHPVEPAPHLVYALNEAIKIILEEGMENRFRRNRIAGQALRAAVKEVGLEIYPLREKDASNTVTAIINPEGISNDDILRILRQEFGVIVGGGLEETFRKVIRIAHMGITSDEMYIMRTIYALERTLSKLGYKLELGAGIKIAKRIFEKSKNLC